MVGGSLPDGRYRLILHAEKIRDGHANSLDGDGDGNSGGDRTEAFFRLYGDSDGDADVDLIDLGRFLSTLGRRRGDSHYLSYMDFNGDDRVSLIDLLAFAHQLGKHLNP